MQTSRPAGERGRDVPHSSSESRSRDRQGKRDDYCLCYVCGSRYTSHACIIASEDCIKEIERERISHVCVCVTFVARENRAGDPLLREGA